MPRRWLQHLVTLFFVVCVASWAQPDMLRSARRVSQSLAEVSEAAGNLVGASANVSVAVANVVADAILVAQGVADEAYRGVDVTDLKLGRIFCKAIGDTRWDLVQYLQRGAAQALPPRASAALHQAVVATSAAVKVAEVQHDFFDAKGEYWVFYIKGRERADGSVVGTMIVRNASFIARWTNPGWDACGYDVSSQSRRIADRLLLAMGGLGDLPRSAVAIDDATIFRDFGIRVQRRAIWWSWAWYVATIVGTVVALRFSLNLAPMRAIQRRLLDWQTRLERGVAPDDGDDDDAAYLTISPKDCPSAADSTTILQ